VGPSSEDHHAIWPTAILLGKFVYTYTNSCFLLVKGMKAKMKMSEYKTIKRGEKMNERRV
jgi:hypothetical protein